MKLNVLVILLLPTVHNSVVKYTLLEFRLLFIKAVLKPSFLFVTATCGDIACTQLVQTSCYDSSPTCLMAKGKNVNKDSSLRITKQDNYTHLYFMFQLALYLMLK